MSDKKQDNKDIEEKLQNVEDELKRAVADYRNLEKRIHEDSMVVAKSLRDQLVLRILPVLDSLDQAVVGASDSEADSGWLKGVLLSIKQLRQILSDEGLVEIPAEGMFDPDLHEAIDTADGEDNKILKVLQRGYTLSGKVLRPAKVVVGKQESADLTQEQSESLKEEVEENG